MHRKETRNGNLASHRGGSWETLVRSIKLTYRKTLGRATVLQEELRTILCEVEAVLNSHPLTFLDINHREPSPFSSSFLNWATLNLSTGAATHKHCQQCSKSNSKMVMSPKTLKPFLGKMEERIHFEINISAQYQEVHAFNCQGRRSCTTWRPFFFPGRDSAIRACKLLLPEQEVFTCSIQKLHPLEIS